MFSIDIGIYLLYTQNVKKRDANERTEVNHFSNGQRITELEDADD